MGSLGFLHIDLTGIKTDEIFSATPNADRLWKK